MECCSPGVTYANSLASNRSRHGERLWCSRRHRRPRGDDVAHRGDLAVRRHGSPLDTSADLFAIVGLLFLGAVALTLAGIDTGRRSAAPAPAGRSPSRPSWNRRYCSLLCVVHFCGVGKFGCLVANTIDRPGQVASLAGVLASPRWSSWSSPRPGGCRRQPGHPPRVDNGARGDRARNTPARAWRSSNGHQVCD